MREASVKVFLEQRKHYWVTQRKRVVSSDKIIVEQNAGRRPDAALASVEQRSRETRESESSEIARGGSEVILNRRMPNPLGYRGGQVSFEGVVKSYFS